MKEALKLALEALWTTANPKAEEAITAIKAALAQPTSGDYALGYAEGFNDACKPKPAQEPDHGNDDLTIAYMSGVHRGKELAAQPVHVISEQEQLKQWIETTKYFTAKREYEPWCMKMNGCKTKCADCPDEPAQEPVALAQQEPDYAYPTIEDFEEITGFKVSDTFRMGWAMARTTNDLFRQMEKQP